MWPCNFAKTLPVVGRFLRIVSVKGGSEASSVRRRCMFGRVFGANRNSGVVLVWEGSVDPFFLFVFGFSMWTVFALSPDCA